MTQQPPDARPFLQRLLSRKFIVAVLVSAAGILGVVSKAIPLDVNALTWILAPVLVWIVGESVIDRSKVSIPEVAGPLDNIARVLLGLSGVVPGLPGDTSPPPTPAQVPWRPVGPPPIDPMLEGPLTQLRRQVEAQKPGGP